MSFVFAMSAPPRAQLVATTPSVEFGNQIVGVQTVSPLLAQITNTSTQFAYTVTSVSSSLNQFGYFVSGSFTIAPGGALNVWVWFTPSSAQIYSGALTFTTSHGHTIQVALAGNGIPYLQSLAQLGLGQGVLSAESSTIDFGLVSVGGSASKVISITNSGAANVTFSNVGVSGPGVDVFGFSNGQVIVPGQTVAAFLTFTPAVSGGVAGNVTISSDASNPQVVISVSGSGAGQQTSGHPVSLTWNPSVSDVVIGYNVYRSLVSGGFYSLLISGPNPSTNYTDMSVQSGQTYYYVVTAVDSSSAESDYSSEVSASVP